MTMGLRQAVPHRLEGRISGTGYGEEAHAEQLRDAQRNGRKLAYVVTRLERVTILLAEITERSL
jgi:hypothetical protein